MDEQTLYALMVDLHRDGLRQGPGSDEETCRALKLTQLDQAAPISIADIGCGTGASTLVLATQLPNATIRAVDLFPEFLEPLMDKARDAGCAERIEILAASMDALPFETESLDLIWSEGAIYNIGFRNGVESWRPYLRPGGVMAVSEITWLHPDPPAEISEHWNSEYPEIATAPEKIAILESAGYDLIGYFVLPSNCWLDNYYEPTAGRIPDFLARHGGGQEATQVVEMERQEVDLYRKYQDSFSYGFYVVRKR
jgi:SAM-dependent methyltransferase